MFKKYLLLFIIFVSIFGCKNKNRVSYDGVLIHRDDLPFKGYAPHYGPEEHIFLKTSISDSKFPDGVRYYLIYPKNKHYQDFKNNLGRKIMARGEETYWIEQIDMSYQSLSPDYEGLPEYQGSVEYRLENAKIVKVY